MTGLNRYFSQSTKPLPIGRRSICATVIINLEKDFEDVMNNTLVELKQENIRLSKKRLTIFAT